MNKELLVGNERRHLMPVLPAMFEETRSKGLKRQYDTKAKQLADTTDTNYPAYVAVSVARNNLTNRIKHAQRSMEDIQKSGLMFAEYDSHFEPDDNIDELSPEKRADLFLTARYLPDFELYVRFLIGERKQALDTSMSQRALQLIASEYSDMTIVQDSPRTRVKVTRIITADNSLEDGYAVVTTKTDGLSLKLDDQIIDVKERQSGIVPVNTLPFGEVRRAFTYIGNIAIAKGVVEDDMTPERRKTIVEHLTQTDAYQPVLERLYLARSRED